MCLLFAGGEIVLPSFIYHNRYSSAIFESEEFRLPNIIENWEEIAFGVKRMEEVQVQNAQTSDITLEEVTNLEPTKNISYRVLKDGKELEDFGLVRSYLQ